MRFEGILRSWDDALGVGVIEPVSGGQPVSLPIAAYPRRATRPQRGERLSYEVDVDHRGFKRARSVRIQPSKGAAARRRQQASGRLTRLGTALPIALLCALLAWAVVRWHLPATVVAAYAALSVATGLVFSFDKSAARAARRRVPERVLLALGLAGGWPGALLAMRYLRHKSAKPAFQVALRIVIVLNLAALVVVASPWFHPWRLGR